jgi:hypothetical protein
MRTLRFVSDRTRVYAATLAIVIVVALAFLAAQRRSQSDLSSEAVSELAIGTGQFLLMTAVSGIGSMAAIETAKRLLGLRGLFHASQVRRYSDEWHVRIEASFFRDSNRAESLEKRTLARRLDIPLEQLCAQMSLRVDQSIARLTTTYVRPEDLALMEMFAWDERPQHPEVAVIVNDLRHGKFVTDPGYTERAPYQQLLGEIRVEAERWIDEFQFRVGNNWRWRVRLAASASSAIMAGLAIVVFPLSTVGNLSVLLGAFVFGGFFASLARDLSGLAERRRL